MKVSFKCSVTIPDRKEDVNMQLRIQDISMLEMLQVFKVNMRDAIKPACPKGAVVKVFHAEVEFFDTKKRGLDT